MFVEDDCIKTVIDVSFDVIFRIIDIDLDRSLFKMYPKFSSVKSVRYTW